MPQAVRQLQFCAAPSVLFLSVLPISRYLVNRYRFVIFRTTLRRQLISTEYEIGEVVATAGIAPATGYTFVPHQGLQEPQGLQRLADRGFSHVSKPILAILRREGKARPFRPAQRYRYSSVTNAAGVRS